MTINEVIAILQAWHTVKILREKTRGEVGDWLREHFGRPFCELTFDYQADTTLVHSGSDRESVDVFDGAAWDYASSDLHCVFLLKDLTTAVELKLRFG